MSGVHWVTEPHAYLEPKIDKTGYGSIKPMTVIECFQETVRKHPNSKAMAAKVKVNGVLSTEWKYWTYTEYWAECMKFAKTLAHLKVDNFKIVNIIGFNSPEWFIACVGSILAGCIGTGIYTSNLSEACHYISEHSKAEVLVVEGNVQLAKYVNFKKNQLPHLKQIVVYGPDAIDQALVSKCAFPVCTWDQFQNMGVEVTESEMERRASVIRPGNCASLIYTSGTTGPPKAVMISHDNITWTAKNVIENYLYLSHEERIISYLPLSHIAGQLIDIYFAMILGACAYFAQPDALKGSLTNTMKEVKPTLFFGVPRVWEKIEEKMVAVGKTVTGIKAHLSRWAKSVGTANSENKQFGKRTGAPCGYSLANVLVFQNVRKALGLEECKLCLTAAAPISIDTLRYFASLDIPVLEVFGQSECTGPHTMSSPTAWRIGYCGRPMVGTESAIVDDTKEVIYRGRHIFMGYMYMPKQTAETIDDQGFLHSGDVAEFDNNDDPRVKKPSGFMRITGRIKELIITAGGENIPPVLIENEMKAAMPALSNCMVIGDKKKFLTMLVSVKTEVDLSDGRPKDELTSETKSISQSLGSPALTYTGVKKCPLWKAYIDKGMKTGNSKTTSNAQIVQKWAWLPQDFSEKEGDLTPTLKLKRSVVTAKYTELIDTLYVE